jgi:thioesterase domain-containing protein
MKEIQIIRSLQKRIEKNIPISKQTGFKITGYDGKSLTSKAPFKNNRNDKGAVFAGSLYSVSALTGWAFITQRFLDESIDAEVVIYSGNIVYHKPVKEDFETVCNSPDEKSWNAFKEKLYKRKNNKIVLETDIFIDDELKVHFSGEYFAWIKKHDE